MTINMNIGERLKQGRQLARAGYKSEDAAKLGILRAGNSGIMSPSGDVAGSCHRVAHLRQLGIELDIPDDPLLIMFQVGISNEDIVYADLLHTSGEDEVILRETEVPTKWVTTNGTAVTGRPDMVLCKKVQCLDEKTGQVETQTLPVLGLELKSVASVWTTRSVLVEGKPKLAHLAQAGHYAWQLGVPFKLVYKQYAIQGMPDFAHKFFPREGQPGSEYLEYGTDGKPRTVRPFEIVYDLVFNADGILQYRKEGTEEYTNTAVHKQDIQRYYEFVSEMGPEKKLGPVPMTLGPTGDKASYSNCKYCKLNDICKSVKKDTGKRAYNKWMKLILARGDK